MTKITITLRILSKFDTKSLNFSLKSPKTPPFNHFSIKIITKSLQNNSSSSISTFTPSTSLSIASLNIKLSINWWNCEEKCFISGSHSAKSFSHKEILIFLQRWLNLVLSWSGKCGRKFDWFFMGCVGDEIDEIVSKFNL